MRRLGFSGSFLACVAVVSALALFGRSDSDSRVAHGAVRWPTLPDVVHPFASHDDALVARGLFEPTIDARGSVLLRASSTPIELAIVGFGREPRPIAARRTYVEAGRAVVDRGAAREWFAYAAAGLEHGLDIEGRPEGEGRVKVRLGVQGARPEREGDDVVLVDASGTERLAYRDLVVVDANGRTLPSSMRVVDGAIELAYDDRDARYPVRVDPFLSGPSSILAEPDAERFADDGCGVSTAIHGDVAIVGCPLAEGANNTTNTGKVLVFTRTGPSSTWVHSQTLVPSNATAEARFGRSVAFEGGALIVGSPGYPGAGVAGSGLVYIYTFDSNSLAFTEYNSISSTNAIVQLGFGTSVAIDANTFAVGSELGGAGTGRVDLYSSAVPTVWQEALVSPDPTTSDRFGWSLGYESGTLVVGAPNHDHDASSLDSGAAYLYTVSDSGSGPMASAPLTLGDPSPLQNGRFGFDVDIDGSIAAVGKPRANTARGIASGAVIVYAEADGALLSTVTAPDGTAGDFFGTSVARHGGYLVVGSPGVLALADASAASRVGAAYLFTPSSTSFVFASKLVDTDAAGADLWGADVDVDAVANRAIVGVPRDSVGTVVARSGSARVFEIPPHATLAVTVLGSGTVTSTPDGIACPDLCEAVYATSATVTLTATPDTGFYLESVANDCSSNPCTLSASSDRHATFTFAAQRDNGAACTESFQCQSEFCTGTICCAGPCDDGNPCNGVESCGDTGECVSTPPPLCTDDGNPCTVELCVEGIGCTSTWQSGCVFGDGGVAYLDGGAGDGAAGPDLHGRGGCDCTVAHENGNSPAIPVLIVLLGVALFRRMKRARA